MSTSIAPVNTLRPPSTRSSARRARFSASSTRPVRRAMPGRVPLRRDPQPQRAALQRRLAHVPDRRPRGGMIGQRQHAGAERVSRAPVGLAEQQIVIQRPQRQLRPRAGVGQAALDADPGTVGVDRAFQQRVHVARQLDRGRAVRALVMTVSGEQQRVQRRHLDLEAHVRVRLARQLAPRTPAPARRRRRRRGAARRAGSGRRSGSRGRTPHAAPRAGGGARPAARRRSRRCRAGRAASSDRRRARDSASARSR